MNAQTRRETAPDYTPHARAERLIAAGRFVLASFSLLTVYLEPSTPARHQQSTYTLLAIYTVYALAIAIVAWRSAVPPMRWRLVSHALDLVLFSVFVYLTEGPASPFFLYFIFSLFCATLRFSWRGILATGAAAIAIYGLMTVAAIGDPSFDPSRVLIREVYLGVIAALLVYLGIYQQRLRAELASLAAWPRAIEPQLDDLLRLTLQHAADVLKSPRILLTWEESEEPWIYVAAWDGRSVSVLRIAPGEYELAVPDHLQNTSFSIRADSSSILVYDPARSMAEERTGDAIGGSFRRRFELDSAIVVPVTGETLSVHLFVPGFRNATADDLALAHIAARLVVAALEQYFFVQQVRQTASAEERLRISRELHDGILQSLGGVGLQLQAIRADLRDASAVSERLAHVQSIIEHDQRELRAIVRELRPHDPRGGNAIVLDELRRMRERFPLEWGLEVDVEVPAPVDVPARLAHELCRIVNESLSNAARHGGASRASVLMDATGDVVRVRVTDNGRGFPFHGRHDLGALERVGNGPRTLTERVKTLGGSLTIQSSAGGASVEARIPVLREVVA